MKERVQQGLEKKRLDEFGPNQNFYTGQDVAVPSGTEEWTLSLAFRLIRRGRIASGVPFLKGYNPVLLSQLFNSVCLTCFGTFGLLLLIGPWQR